MRIRAIELTTNVLIDSLNDFDVTPDTILCLDECDKSVLIFSWIIKNNSL